MSVDVSGIRIGFAGIGVMGAAIVERLLAAKCDLTLWNRTPERLASFTARGVKQATTPRALAEGCDLILTCVLDAAAIDEIILGETGVAAAAKPVTIVDHSSISPTETIRIDAEFRARTGGRWIDAPVSGGAAAAARGALIVLIGGAAADVGAVKPVLSLYAARQVHMGPVGNGQLTKLCNQIIVGTTMASIAEAMRFAADAGLDAARIPQALLGGMADSLPFQLLAPRMVSPSNDPIGHVASMLKDLEAANQCAMGNASVLPVLAAATELFRQAAAHGLARQEPSILFQFLDRSTPANAGGEP